MLHCAIRPKWDPVKSLSDTSEIGPAGEKFLAELHEKQEIVRQAEVLSEEEPSCEQPEALLLKMGPYIELMWPLDI